MRSFRYIARLEAGGRKLSSHYLAGRHDGSTLSYALALSPMNLFYLKGGNFKKQLFRWQRVDQTPMPLSLRNLRQKTGRMNGRSEEHTSELQSRGHLVCR